MFTPDQQSDPPNLHHQDFPVKHFDDKADLSYPNTHDEPTVFHNLEHGDVGLTPRESPKFDGMGSLEISIIDQPLQTLNEPIPKKEAELEEESIDACKFCRKHVIGSDFSTSFTNVEIEEVPWTLNHIENVLCKNNQFFDYFDSINVGQRKKNELNFTSNLSLGMANRASSKHISDTYRKKYIKRISHLLAHAWLRFTEIVKRLSARFNKCTKLEVFYAIKLYLPATYLRENCIIACSKALSQYTENNDNFKISKSQRAGLRFDIGRFHRWMVDHKLAGFIKEFASVYAASFMESLCEELSLLLLLADPLFDNYYQITEILNGVMAKGYHQALRRNLPLPCSSSAALDYFQTNNSADNVPVNATLPCPNLADAFFDCREKTPLFASTTTTTWITELCSGLVNFLIRGQPCLPYTSEAMIYSLLNHVRRILDGTLTLSHLAELASKPSNNFTSCGNAALGNNHSFMTCKLGVFSRNNSRELKNIPSPPTCDSNLTNNNRDGIHMAEVLRNSLKTNGSFLVTPIDEILGAHTFANFNQARERIIEATSFLWVNPNFHGFPRHYYYHVPLLRTENGENLGQSTTNFTANSTEFDWNSSNSYNNIIGNNGCNPYSTGHDLPTQTIYGVQGSRSYVFARCPHKLPSWTREACRTFYALFANAATINRARNDQTDGEETCPNRQPPVDLYNWLTVILSLIEHRDSSFITPEDVNQAAAILLPSACPFVNFSSLLNFHEELLLSTYNGFILNNNGTCSEPDNFLNTLANDYLIPSFSFCNGGHSRGKNKDNINNNVCNANKEYLGLELRCKQGIAFQMLSSGNVALVPTVLKLLSHHTTSSSLKRSFSKNINISCGSSINNNNANRTSAHLSLFDSGPNSLDLTMGNNNGILSEQQSTSSGGPSNLNNVNNLTINIIDEDTFIDQQTLITPLMYCCIDSNYSMVKMLLTHGVDIDKDVLMTNSPSCTHHPSYLIEICHWTALSFAVIFRHYNIVELLLQNGANVEGGIKCGEELCFSETPLQLACASGDYGIVSLLLQKGSDPYLCTAYNHRSSCCLPPSPSPTALNHHHHNNHHHHYHGSHGQHHYYHHYSFNQNSSQLNGTSGFNTSLGCPPSSRNIGAASANLNGMDLAVPAMSSIRAARGTFANRPIAGEFGYLRSGMCGTTEDPLTNLNQPSFLDFISNPSALCNNNLNTLAAIGNNNNNHHHVNLHHAGGNYTHHHDSSLGVRAGSHAPFVIAASHGRLDIVRAMLAQPLMPKPRDILSLEEILAEGCSMFNNNSGGGNGTGRSLSSKCPSPTPSGLSNTSRNGDENRSINQQPAFFNFPILNGATGNSTSRTYRTGNDDIASNKPSTSETYPDFGSSTSNAPFAKAEESTAFGSNSTSHGSSCAGTTNKLIANQNSLKIKLSKLTAGQPDQTGSSGISTTLNTLQHTALTQSKSLSNAHLTLTATASLDNSITIKCNPSKESYENQPYAESHVTVNSNIDVNGKSTKEKNRRHSQPKQSSYKRTRAPNLNNILNGVNSLTSNLMSNNNNNSNSNQDASTINKMSSSTTVGNEYLTLEEILAEGYIMPATLHPSSSNAHNSPNPENTQPLATNLSNECDLSNSKSVLTEGIVVSSGGESSIISPQNEYPSSSASFIETPATNSNNYRINNRTNNTGSNIRITSTSSATRRSNPNATTRVGGTIVKPLTKAQGRVLIEAMYHAAESGHVQICLEFRKLGVVWNLHIWMKCLSYMVPNIDEDTKPQDILPNMFVVENNLTINDKIKHSVDVQALLYLLNDFSNLKFEEIYMPEFFEYTFPILLKAFMDSLSLIVDPLLNETSNKPESSTDFVANSPIINVEKYPTFEESTRIYHQIFMAVCRILSSCYKIGLRSPGDDHQLPPPIPTSPHSTRSTLIDSCYVNSPELSDISFLVEGKIFYGHKIILVNSSPRFKAMLCDKFVESNQDIIPIPDIRYDIFKVIMEFLYSGKVDSIKSRDCDFVMELMAASNFFLLDGLQRECEIFSSNILCFKNCVAIYKAARLYNCEELTNYCVGYFLKNLSDLVEFNADTFLEIFTNPEYSNEIYTRIEKIIYNKIFGRLNK